MGDEQIVSAPWIDELEELDADSLESDGGTLVMSREEMKAKAEAAQPKAPRDEMRAPPPPPAPATVIIEERDADKTMKLSREDVALAATLQEIPPPPITHKVLPGSIAPVALDVTVAIPRTAPPPPLASFEAPEAPARQPSPVLGFTIGAVGVAVVLAVAGVIAGVALTGGSSSSETAQASTSPASTPEPRSAVVKGASSVVVDTAAPPSGTTVDKATTEPGLPSLAVTAPAPTTTPTTSEIDVSSLPTAAAPAARPIAVAPVGNGNGNAAPAAQPEPRAAAPAPAQPSAPTTHAAAAAPAPAAPPPPAAAIGDKTMGIIRVPISDSILTIVVDGTYKRVRNGQVAVTCGPHRVRVGTGMAQELNVPCGGSVAAQ